MKIFKDFENIKQGSEVEIVLNNEEATHINGEVVDNKLRQLHILDDVSTDTSIRYEQIESVEIFNSEE